MLICLVHISICPVRRTAQDHVLIHLAPCGATARLPLDVLGLDFEARVGDELVDLVVSEVKPGGGGAPQGCQGPGELGRAWWNGVQVVGLVGVRFGYSMGIMFPDDEGLLLSLGAQYVTTRKQLW